MKIQSLHERAIRAVIEHLSQAVLWTRRGKGGKFREEALPIIAAFEHGSSQELDPQLHTHCVLLNVAARADGTFGTILSKPFYNYKLTAGALYQAALALLLQTEEGLKVEPEGKSFHILGVPKTLLDHYSKRSKQIRNKLDAQGLNTAKAAAQAAVDTRKTKKQLPPPRRELFRRWRETNANFGFTTEKAQKLLRQVTAVSHCPDLSQSITLAIQGLLEHQSFFSQGEVIREVAWQQIGKLVPVEHLVAEVHRCLATNPDIVPLGSLDHEPRFTTREMLALEAEIFDAVEQGKDDTSHVIDKRAVTRVWTEGCRSIRR